MMQFSLLSFSRYSLYLRLTERYSSRRSSSSSFAGQGQLMQRAVAIWKLSKIRYFSST